MPHQQKLIHITDITNVGAAGAQAIATGFLINAQNEPSLAVARQNVSVEFNGADPGGTYRWWLTNITTAGFVFNWAGANAGVGNIRVVAQVFHSICFDISSQQIPY